MKLKYRRIYYSVVIILFLIIAPLLILYASGYRYNFKDKSIIRTGVLTVDSKPRGASIVLNRKIIKKETPAVIKNLSPQEYQVEIKKDGYYDWKKTLIVFPNQATLTNRVTLLKKDIPSLLVKDQVFDFKISLNNSFLAYLTGSEQNPVLVVLKLDSQKELTRLSLLKNSNVNLSFSKSNHYLFVSQEKNGRNNYLIIFLSEQREPLKLTEVSPLNFDKFISSPTSAKVLFASNGKKLYKIDLEKKTAQLFLNDDIEDFIIIENILYYVSIKDGNKVLKKVNIEGASMPQELIVLTNKSRFILGDNTKGVLTLLDKQNKILSLIEPTGNTSFKLKQLDPYVINFNWSSDHKTLLFYNDFELWTYDLETEERELLIRSSEEIQSAYWYPDMTWIIFQQANKIKAVETDSRDKRNIIELTESKASNLYLNNSRETLFFIGQDGNQNGIYELKLK